MVMVKVNEYEYSMDGILKNNLDNLKRDVMEKDFDGFIIISGAERLGKSTLAGQVALYLDPTYNLDRCTFDADEFSEKIKKANKFQAIVFDEAFNYLSSRGALSRYNKSLIKIMAEMGFRNLFVIICIPSFFELDKYPAIHRSVGLLRVYERGKFSSYDFEKKKQLYVMGKKFYNDHAVHPNYRGCFSKLFVLNKEDYNKKKYDAVTKEESKPTGKREMKQNQERDDAICLLYNTFNLSTPQIAEKLNLTATHVWRIVEAKNKLLAERSKPIL